jgi:hypothetical protein
MQTVLKFSVIFLIQGLFAILFAQENVKFESKINSHQSQKSTVGGIVAYYFWEENDAGLIHEKSLSTAFKRNLQIEFQPKKKNTENWDQATIQHAVAQLSDYNGRSKNPKFKTIDHSKPKKRIQIPLQKSMTEKTSSVCFRKKGEKWESEIQKKVIYFDVVSDSMLQFSHASDSFQLDFLTVQLPAIGHFYVKTCKNELGTIIDQTIFSFHGENVTEHFKAGYKHSPKRVLVFSNGYRGMNQNRDESDHLIRRTDWTGYWMKLDKRFIERLNPAETVYIDGNFNINTSGHRNRLKFGASYALVQLFNPKKSYWILNQKPNKNGFQKRRDAGRMAGKAFLTEIYTFSSSPETKDTVDIVCHSMGYAYALGFIDEIRDRVIFGNMYIIAPENGKVGGTDWNLFHEVWQYGSNLDQPNPDPVYEQDGIAPQSQVFGLDSLESNRGGRAFIPADWKPKNFIDSHMLPFYHWIFERIQPGEVGYVGL